MAKMTKRLVTIIAVLFLSFSAFSYIDSYNFTASAASEKKVSLKETPTLKASEITATSAKLKWKKIKGATSYNIYRSTDEKKWEQIKTTEETYYTVKNLKESKKYFFRIRAYNGKQKTSYSKTISVTPALRKIKGAEISYNASGKAVLSWQNVSGATGYEILYSTDPDFKKSNKTIDVTGDKNQYTFKKSKKGSKFYIKIRAVQKTKKSTYFSKYSSVFACKTKLPSPKNPTFVKATVNSITFKWDPVEGAEYYNIYYGICEIKGFSLVGSTKKTSFTIKELSDKNRYKIKIVAKCKGNSSVASEILRLYTLPAKVSAPEVISKDSKNITVGWKKSKYANSYNVYVSTSADGKYKKVGSVKETTFTYTGKKPKTAYYFKVAPLIKNEYQKCTGKLSAYKKATTDNILISLPENIRKGEYPEITVPNYNSKIKWKTSDKSVIKRQNGRFYAVGEGTATITATYQNKYTAKIKVNVVAPTVKYRSAVYDVTNDQFIFKNRINSRCYPASITKLITALVVLKYMDEDDTIVVGSELNLVEAMSSRCGLLKGEKFKLKDILYGLLLPSGGDAAYTLAVNCARKVSGNPNMGYVAAKNYFVRLMNKYMDSIGATGTNCVNPHGYPVNGHYSTVNDLVLVAKKVLENKTLKKITSTSYKYVTSLTGQGHSWGTTNSLIASYAYYYSPYAHGMKTGTVNDNYTGIVSVATKDEKTLITVVIGCESYNARYDATHTLYKRYLY